MTVSAAGLPNFIIAGAPRCGTSSLFAYLSAHPQVAASSVKEVQYFMDETSALFHSEANHRDHGIDGYRAFFADGLNARPYARLVFEATPGYLYQKAALERVPDLPGAPRILFQLRKPSAQIYSSYLYSLNQAANLPRDVTFREFVFGSPRIAASANEFHRNALSFAAYEPFLNAWKSRCGDRMRVACFETLRADPRAYMRDLALWLGIDPAFYDGYGFPVTNRNVEVKSRTLQKLSHRLGSSLKGPLRRLARGLYRTFNTEEVAGPSADDKAVMSEIDEYMREPNMRLAEAFGLSLPGWQKV